MRAVSAGRATGRVNTAGAGSESAEQKALFAWWTMARHRWPGALMFSIPNGGRRDVATGARLKAEGALAGVPDVCLAWPAGGYHGLYLELKKRRGGRASTAQNAVLDALEAAGYRAIVVHGAAEAIATVEAYMAGGAE